MRIILVAGVRSFIKGGERARPAENVAYAKQPCQLVGRHDLASRVELRLGVFSRAARKRGRAANAEWEGRRISGLDSITALLS